MHNARCTSLAAVASLFLAASVAAAPSRTECLPSRAEELAILAACGDETSLSRCLSQIPTELTAADATPGLLAGALQDCFQTAGCTSEESKIEAFWAERRCDEAPSDLRRRHDTRNGAPDAAVMLMAREVDGINMIAARQVTVTQTAAATTTAGSNSSPSPCLTKTQVNVKTCPTQADGRKGPCVDKPQEISVCADGLICRFDKQGAPSCMYKQSGLGVPGTIVAIFFAAAIAISICSVCFFCCRERRVQRRLTRQEEAAKIAQEAKTQAMLNAKKAGPSASQDDDGLDRQPLMAPTGGANPPAMPQQYGAGPGDYDVGNGHGQNPFADSSTHSMRG